MSFIASPETWGEISRFISDNGLREDEYFQFCWPYDGASVDMAAQPIWTEQARWISVYMVVGGSEGWSCHVDRILEAEPHYRIDHVMSGKFWSPAAALRAVDMLTRLFYGVPQEVTSSPADSRQAQLFEGVQR